MQHSKIPTPSFQNFRENSTSPFASTYLTWTISCLSFQLHFLLMVGTIFSFSFILLMLCSISSMSVDKMRSLKRLQRSPSFLQSIVKRVVHCANFLRMDCVMINVCYDVTRRQRRFHFLEEWLAYCTIIIDEIIMSCLTFLLFSIMTRTKLVPI